MRLTPARVLSPAKIASLLGEEADSLLNYRSKTINKKYLHLPGPDFVERVWSVSDRSDKVLSNMRAIYQHGRLAGTGYLSILPVDQGIEHTAGASFAANPLYFDPENIVHLAIEGGCNAVASTVGALGAVARKYADTIPFVVKLNHNELISFPNEHDQVLFATVEQAHNMGAVAVGATIYFGSSETRRQITEVSQAFARAHELGMVTILWCYVRNSAFTIDGINYELSSDITGQANHLGATIQADIVKQKMPEMNRGIEQMNERGKKYSKYDSRMYSELVTENPIDMVRYQVMNGFMGRVGLISSGGASGKHDLAESVRTAVINKRAGGMGMISGRKAFQRPFDEGVELLNAIQDVYLSEDISVA